MYTNRAALLSAGSVGTASAGGTGERAGRGGIGERTGGITSGAATDVATESRADSSIVVCVPTYKTTYLAH